MVEGVAEGSSALRMDATRRMTDRKRRSGKRSQQQQRQKQRRQRWRVRGMTVLSGGGERSETDGGCGGSLIERMAERQSVWVLRRRRRRYAEVEEGAA